MLTSFYSAEELNNIGFGSIGKNVQISRKASFYNPQYIHVGDFSRIDDFCVLSCGSEGIYLGRNVHIAIYTSLIGKAKISIGDFANLSSRVTVYSSNDDYSGEFMTNPTVDVRYTNVRSDPVVIGDHCIIGSGSVILPGVSLGKAVSIGALSLVNHDCQEFGIYAGVPIKFIRDRSRNLLIQEQRLLIEEKDHNES